MEKKDEFKDWNFVITFFETYMQTDKQDLWKARHSYTWKMCATWVFIPTKPQSDNN